MIRFSLSVALVFASIPAFAACPPDAQLMKQKGVVQQFERIVKFHNETFTDADGAIIHGIEPWKLTEQIYLQNSEGCLPDALRRHMIIMLKSSINRHNPESIQTIYYYGESANPYFKYTFGVSMYTPDASRPFVSDFYRWDGQRFRFIKTEQYDS